MVETDERMNMSIDSIFAVYIFCANHHSGQNCRLYRILSRIAVRYRPKIFDSAWQAIQDGEGRVKEEWVDARRKYQQLCFKQKRIAYGGRRLS